MKSEQLSFVKQLVPENQLKPEELSLQVSFPT